MKSYRALGPVVNGDVDLNQQALITYTGEYTSGDATQYIRTGMYNIPEGSVKSIVITSAHGNDTSEDIVPIFKLFWDPSGNPTVAPT